VPREALRGQVLRALDERGLVRTVVRRRLSSRVPPWAGIHRNPGQRKPPPQEGAEKLARGKVRILFLPPYSPDYNPIEKSWANMKRFLRDNLRDFFMVGLLLYEYFVSRNLA